MQHLHQDQAEVFPPNFISVDFILLSTLQKHFHSVPKCSPYEKSLLSLGFLREALKYMV